MINDVKKMLKDDDAVGMLEAGVNAVCGTMPAMTGGYVASLIESILGTLCGCGTGMKAGFGSIFKLLRMIIG